MKKRLILLLKLLIPAAILYVLFRQIEPEQIEVLRSQPKHWGRLFAAFSLAFFAVSLTFVRWWLLVRTLRMPFRLLDAFRLGFLGYLLSFVSAGSVGGDLFKAVFIAREQPPRRRAEAVASVLVDRVVGLYALLIVASVGILATGGSTDDPSLKVLTPAVLTATVVGGLGLCSLLLPTLTDGWVSKRVASLPWIGGPASQVIAGVRMYKNAPGIMGIIALCSVAGHVCFAIVLYLIATGLFRDAPPLLEHLFMGPLAMIANALPLTPGGLGQLEVALQRLYETFPQQPHAASGVLVALAFRITTLAIAGVGAVFYLRGRGEVEEVMDEAKALEEASHMESDGGQEIA